MNLQRIVSVVCGVLLCASVASAQSSAINGTVKDASGAVLPGVTVEVTSSALIEQARSAVTDGNGMFQIINLPAGLFKVTFSLPGFSSVVRDNLSLPGDFTATVNVDLKIGGLEETITVSGASPVVDIQSTARAQVVTREMLDVLPTGKTVQTMAALVPGIATATVDVGGSGSMNQNYTTAHGMGAREVVVMLDGIALKGMESNGITQSYTNTQNYEEVIYQTNGAGADVSGGGVRQLIVPRRGGNEFHGNFSGVYTDGKWQANNVTPELEARGLRGLNKIDNLSTFEGGQGGRIVRDKLWFFSTARRQSVNELVAGMFYRDGTQAATEQHLENYGTRLTWQVSRRNQVTGFVDRVFKYLGNGDGGAGYEVETATRTWYRSPLYQQSSSKWTSTLNNRLLVDAGFNQYQAQRNSDYQPGVAKPFGSPGWYAGAPRVDTSRGTTTTAAPNGHQVLEPIRNAYGASASYVTGSHNIKIGVQGASGYQNLGTVEFNAALQQTYQNGVPTSVSVNNAPVRFNNVLAGDWGVFAQDVWTFNRMTLTYGLRWERFDSYVGSRGENPEVSGTSRFIAANRSFGPERMPLYTDFAPRLGAVYDLFGTGKTAVKVSANRYEAQMAAGLAEVLNPIRFQTATLTWNDLNQDDIAQGELGCTFGTAGCEINLSQLPANFGQTPAGCSTLYAPDNIPCGTSQVDPNIEREYSWNYQIGLQQALLGSLSVSVNYYRTNFRNAYTDFSSTAQGYNPLTDNVLQSASDYTPVQIISPLDGSAITMYNINAAKISQVRNVIFNDDERRRWNNAFDVGINARLFGKTTVFGGFATERTQEVACGQRFTNSDPNRKNFCDMTTGNIPWRSQLKLAGSTQIAGMQLGVAFQSTPRLSSPNSTVWQVTRTTRYAADCLGPCTPGALVNPGQTVATLNVPLESPYSRLADRVNQLDVNVGRWFGHGRFKVMPTLSVFNSLNSSAVLTYRSLNYLTSTYLQPASVVQPRMLRLGVDLKW